MKVHVVFEHTAGPMAGLRQIVGVWHDAGPLPGALPPFVTLGRTVRGGQLVEGRKKWVLYREVA